MSDEVTRLRGHIESGVLGNPDLIAVIDRLEAAERERDRAHERASREERATLAALARVDELRERLESAEAEIVQWRRGVGSAAVGVAPRFAVEQWERWHARLKERLGGCDDK